MPASAPLGRRLMPRGIGVAAALLVLSGCGNDGSGPSRIEGTYALRQLNQSPLPYDHEGLGCCVYLSGTLELDEGRYAAALTAQNRNNDLVFTASEWGSYTRSGSAVTFAWDSIDVAGLLLDAGTISGDSIRLVFGGEGPGSPDQFEAVYLREP
jgi:hypothetical protein